MSNQTRRSEESQTRGQQYDLWQECARQLRLMGFSLRQFLTVPYFIQLLISTVLGSVILQALAVPVEGQLPAGSARSKKYCRPIAEEAAQRIETLGGSGLDLNHGRGGNTGVRGNVLEGAAHGDRTGTQNGDGVRQILDFAEQVTRQ